MLYMSRETLDDFILLSELCVAHSASSIGLARVCDWNSHTPCHFVMAVSAINTNDEDDDVQTYCQANKCIDRGYDHDCSVKLSEWPTYANNCLRRDVLDGLLYQVSSEQSGSTPPVKDRSWLLHSSRTGAKNGWASASSALQRLHGLNASIFFSKSRAQSLEPGNTCAKSYKGHKHRLWRDTTTQAQMHKCNRASNRARERQFLDVPTPILGAATNHIMVAIKNWRVHWFRQQRRTRAETMNELNRSEVFRADGSD